MDIKLKKYTTFKIGEEPKNFFIVKNVEDINSVFLKIKNEKYFILGGGSNILISENIKEYNIIKLENNFIEFSDNIVNVSASYYFQLFINDAINKSLKGLEWGAGIPGTVGGAIFGNSGSFGGEIKDNILEVEVYNIKNKKIEILKKIDCNFSYRSSIFKESKNKYIILSAKFLLEKIDNNIEIKNIYNQNLEKKKNTQPIGEYSAGCVFKNIIYDEKNEKLMNFMKNYKEDIIFKEKKQIPTAFIIDKLGLKGLEENNAEISNVHANFIVNKSNAEYRDVKALIEIIKEKIKIQFNINLEEEIEEI